MPSTKIINVTRDDDFESVFNIFEGTSAKEVIFILPKNSRFAKNAEHFIVIKNKAEELGKVVNIMSEDENLQEFVEDLGFKFLTIERAKPKKKKLIQKHTPITTAAKDMDIVAKPISDEEEDDDEEDEPIPNELRTEPIQEEIEPPEPVPMIEETEIHNNEPEDNDNNEQREAPETEFTPTVEPMEPSKSSDLEKLWFGLAKTSQKLKEKIPTSEHRSGGSKKKRYITYSTAAAVVLVVSVFTAYSKAQVVLRPEKQDIDFEIQMTASINASGIDSIKNIIPGQVISVNDKKSGEFKASGADDVVKKSDGIIRIVNNTTSNQILVATTRFESPSGKIYRISETVTVPGNGSLEIEIIADRAGETYVESKGVKFNIPGFKEAELVDKYENIYGEAVTEIGGGYIGEASLVTEEDFNKAKNSLTDSSLGFVLDHLRSRTADLNLKDIHSVAQLATITSTAEVEDVAESFNMEVEVEGKTMLADPEHIKEVINAYLERSGNLEIVDQLTEVRYEESTFSEDQSEVSFRVVVDGQAAPKINSDQIISNLLGKDEAEITQYIKGIEEIGSARILLSPFWVKSLPKKEDRITIKFEY